MKPVWSACYCAASTGLTSRRSWRRAEQEPPAELVEALHAETEGNPFFVEEVLRHLVETGALRREGERWTSDQQIAKLGIPESVRDVVGGRLSRLSETANDVLGIASVFGRDFDVALVASVDGAPEGVILDALDEVLHAHLMREPTLPVAFPSATHWCVRRSTRRSARCGA